MDGLAWLRGRSGDSEGARRLYWEALERYGNDAESGSVTALIDGLETLFEGAERDLLAREWERRRRRSEEAGRRTMAVRARWARARAIKHQKPIQAAVWMAEGQESVRPALDDPRILLELAESLERLGDISSAVRWYGELLRWHPRAIVRETAEFQLGRHAQRSKDPGKALEHFRCAERLGAGLVSKGALGLGRAECLHALGRLEEGLAVLKGLLADPFVAGGDKAGALMMSGDWLTERGRVREALVYSERVYLVYGRYVDLVARAYWKRGKGLVRIGEEAKAREVFEELTAREDLRECSEVGKTQRWLEG